MINNISEYVDYNKWFRECRGELKLKMFIDDLDYYTNRNYLYDMFPPHPNETYKDHKIFIDYMSQGFNRHRKPLERKFNVKDHTIKNISFKHGWRERMDEWERVVINHFINYLALPFLELENTKYPWSKMDGENNFKYFCFLCYLCLNQNREYTMPQLHKTMLNYGVNVTYNSIKQYSADFKWKERKKEYFSNKEVIQRLN